MQSIVLADDHPIVRMGIRRILETRDDLEVIAEVSDGQEAVDAVLEKKPDLALMDIEMPKLSGIDATRSIANRGLKTKVLILSMHESGSHVEKALRAGASGYIVKSAGLREVLRAIDTIQEGGSYLSPSVTSQVVCALSSPAGSPAERIRQVTEREREVLQLVADGLASREIAERLGVSVKTVDTHRANLMQKLGVHKASSLVLFAVREGLVTV